MADLAFAPQHNMIAYLEKTESNAEFHQIVDFLRSSSIHHSIAIHAIVDGKTVVITESSVRRDLLFTDTNGITCLTNEQIFENLLLMGYEAIDPHLSTGYIVGSGEERMEHDIELTNHVPQKPHDSPLLGGHTPGSDEGSMTLTKLTNFCTTLLHKVLDLENFKTAQAKEIDSLKKIVIKLDQRQSSRFSGFHPLRAGTSKRHSLGRKKTRVMLKKEVAQQKQLVLLGHILVLLSTTEPKTPPPTTTLFDDKDVTIADTLIDADHELAVRLTHEEQEKYTVEEWSFEEIQKLYIKEQKWVDAFVLIGSEEDKKRIGSRKKRAVGSSSKHKSHKKQKVNDQESKDNDKEHRKCLKVVLDDEKAIDYETFDVKSLIVNYESQVLGTNEAGDVYVYKLTRLDGSYRHFSTFSRMLEFLDRQDVLDLYKIIMERFPANDPEGYV
uniref:Uncharacterized protein n=1 Tax=Tanacetum cinerariifolium TaxID=118510 RepID=A0A6L2NH00_TANCI|nr:hypothetical protein [Tanacetum cinerariifolium]